MMKETAFSPFNLGHPVCAALFNICTICYKIIVNCICVVSKLLNFIMRAICSF